MQVGRGTPQNPTPLGISILTLLSLDLYVRPLSPPQIDMRATPWTEQDGIHVFFCR